MKIESYFTFHNVGQGLFYSGDIILPNETFRFIYDCGSEKIKFVKSSILRYKHNNNTEINLLILSHLHYDHISGLNELFKNFKVKTVILPYFFPIERLFIATKNINHPNWYYDLLSDPIKFFIEKKNVKKVIIIGGNYGENQENQENQESKENRIKKPDNFNIENYEIDTEFNIDLPDDENLSNEIIENDPNWNEYINKGQLLIKNHNGHIYAVNNLWLFRFFNYKVFLSTIKQFQNCVKRIGGNIKEYILDKNKLKKLKPCYNPISKQLKNDFNNTSLVLYHKPILGKIKNLIYISFPNLHYCFDQLYNLFDIFDISPYIPFKDNKGGQILTGDLDLNVKYSEFINHFYQYIDDTKIFQVPHHGASKNWNRNVISNFSTTSFWVISAGLTNKYGHPSFNVIEDINFNNKNCCWVNETNFIRIKMILHLLTK